jgi:hypothetical protein
LNITLKPLQIAGLMAAAMAAIVGVWLLRNFDPNVAGNIFPPCVFHELTGFWCVGCGATRMMHALVHGNIARAFSMNPLAMLILIISPIPIAWKLGWQPKIAQPLIALLSKPQFWLVLLPAYWIARNLPWFPFTLLAPH